MHLARASTAATIMIALGSSGAGAVDPAQITFTTTNASGHPILWRIEATPGAVAENLSAQLDALASQSLPGDHRGPISVASDGSFFVFRSERFDPDSQGWPGLTVAAADWSAVETIRVAGVTVHDEGLAQATPGAGAVVFVAGDGPHARDLFVVERDGATWSTPRLLTTDSPFAFNTGPVLSRDGTKLLFDAADESFPSTHVCEVGLDGAGFRVVVSKDDGPAGLSPSPAAHSGAYLPNGSIVFEAEWGGGERIWRLPAGGGTPELVQPAASNDNSPVALPDGRIASLFLGAPESPGLHEIKLMNPDGSASSMLTQTGPLFAEVDDIGMGAGAVPVPEPGTALCDSAVVAMWAVLRRRRRGVGGRSRERSAARACTMPCHWGRERRRTSRGFTVHLPQLLLSLLLTASPLSAAAAGVVGTGTPESCTALSYATALVGGGAVSFACGAAPIVILVDTAVIEDGVTTTVDGAGKVTLDGEDLRQIFVVLAGGDLTLRDLTLQNGYGSFVDGGAIRNDGATRLEGVAIESSSADAGSGGAVLNTGVLQIQDSRLSANSATGDAGAVRNAGGTLTIERSLFVQNVAGAAGGALSNASGTASVVNSTFADNFADHGGAIDAAGGSVSLQNDTLHGNFADLGGVIWDGGGDVSARNTVFSASLELDGISPALECDGSALPIASQGGNVAEDGSCLLTGEGDLERTDPGLGPLVDNGGPTLTHAPLPGSALIDAGLADGCPATDQRGLPRPVDGDGVGGARCDTGAVEAPEPTAWLTGAIALAALGCRRSRSRSRRGSSGISVRERDL
jgi:hypothetical protein